MINTAAKSILVQLCYYMTREISSTFSRINCQTSIPAEKYFILAQKEFAFWSRVEKFFTIIFEHQQIKISYLPEFPVSVLFYINT